MHAWADGWMDRYITWLKLTSETITYDTSMIQYVKQISRMMVHCVFCYFVNEKSFYGSDLITNYKHVAGQYFDMSNNW